MIQRISIDLYALSILLPNKQSLFEKTTNFHSIYIYFLTTHTGFLATGQKNKMVGRRGGGGDGEGESRHDDVNNEKS